MADIDLFAPRRMVRQSLATPLLLVLGLAACAPPDDESVSAEDSADTETETVYSALTVLPSAPTNLPVEIYNIDRGTCLAATGTGNFASVAMQPCFGGKNQLWFVIPATQSGRYHVRPASVGWRHLATAGFNQMWIVNTGGANQTLTFDDTGLGNYQVKTQQADCLTATTSVSQSVTHENCLGAAPAFAPRTQQWKLRPRPSNFHLIAKHSNLCIDVAWASQDDGAVLQQYPCVEGAANQRWYLEPDGVVAGSQYYRIRSTNSGKCIDVPGFSTTNDLQLQQYTCNGGDNQRWFVGVEGDGRVRIQNKANAKCLHVNGGTEVHAPVTQHTCDASDGEKFFYTNYVQRHVQVVQVAMSNGSSPTLVSDAAIQAQVQVANNVYRQYGVELLYDPATDKSSANDDCLFTLEEANSGAWGCATNLAATFPGKVVIFVRPGTGDFSYGWINFMAMKPLNSGTICTGGSAPNTRYLAHEFGHYMGLQHVMPSDNDLLGDTLSSDPGGVDPCLAPTTPSPPGNYTYSKFGFSITINTDNIMSYFHHVTPRITTSQASIVRGTSYARFY